MLDLEEVRSVLAPLDLVPLFLVVGGDHLFGFPEPVAHVRVRCVHSSALGAALGEGGRASSLSLTLLDRGLSVRVLSEEPAQAARRLARGDGTLLEEVRSPLVLSGEDEVRELASIAAGLVTRSIHGHYRRLARGALRRLTNDPAKRVRHVLALFRAILAGVHALETGEILPHLPTLAEGEDLPFLRDLLLRRPGSPLVGDPARFEFLMAEARALFERLDAAADRTSLPDRPRGVPALEEWVERHTP